MNDRYTANLVEVLSAADRAVVDAAGYGKRMGFGDRPALLVVDATYGFVGNERLPLLEAIAKQRKACGEMGWDAVDQITRLIATAREHNVPILYSVMSDSSSESWVPGLWPLKNFRAQSEASTRDPDENRVVCEIAPSEDDIVYVKNHPSIFLGTDALDDLRSLGVDSVIICGGATSGCVRASAVDAFSLGFRVAAVSDASFDRLELSHKVSLLDIDLKYGDVISTSEWVDHMARVGTS